jgi:hypothetical protein
MEPLTEEKFIKGVESLINPMEVSSLLYLQRLKRLLPSFILKKLLHRASKNTPYIGFVIEPYSLFLFFKLKDIEKARSLLPDRYELAKAKIFADDEPDYYLGIGNLGTRASTFWGVRQELYLIGKDKETGLPSWIFLDILSNTLIALPTKGVANPNCKKAVFTTNSKGHIFLDITEDKTKRRMQLKGSIKNGKTRKLDQPLWLMGNTSIGHSTALANGDDKPFAVIFDPDEVVEGLEIPPEDIHIAENSLFSGLADSVPCKVICFPYAQHYIADSPGCHTSVKDFDDVVAKYNDLSNTKKFKTFSAKTIEIQLLIGVAASITVAVLLSIIL